MYHREKNRSLDGREVITPSCGNHALARFGAVDFCCRYERGRLLPKQGNNKLFNYYILPDFRAKPCVGTEVSRH